MKQVLEQIIRFRVVAIVEDVFVKVSSYFLKDLHLRFSRMEVRRKQRKEVLMCAHVVGNIS